MQSLASAEIISAKEKGIKEIAETAAGFLKKGKIIIYPTETCYGIGADALDEEAVKKVHDAKKQDYSKPVSVIVPSAAEAGKIAVLGAKEKLLIRKFMPGPLTIIVKKKSAVPDILSRETIAFRISSNKIANAIAKKFGSAITATSANLHGMPEIYNSKEAIDKFGGIAGMVIDAGILPKKRPSTIYDSVKNAVIREGEIKKEEIEKALEKK